MRAARQGSGWMEVGWRRLKAETISWALRLGVPEERSLYTLT